LYFSTIADNFSQRQWSDRARGSASLWLAQECRGYMSPMTAESYISPRPWSSLLPVPRRGPVTVLKHQVFRRHPPLRLIAGMYSCAARVIDSGMSGAAQTRTNRIERR
jgi:hypothetical protein